MVSFKGSESLSNIPANTRCWTDEFKKPQNDSMAEVERDPWFSRHLEQSVQAHEDPPQRLWVPVTLLCHLQSTEVASQKLQLGRVSCHVFIATDKLCYMYQTTSQSFLWYVCNHASMKLTGEKKKPCVLPNKCQMREIQVFTTFSFGRQHLLPQWYLSCCLEELIQLIP